MTTIEMLREQVNSINAAIRKIEDGAQEYRIGNRTLRRGDLAALYSERRKLTYELTVAEAGGGTYLGAFYR